MPRVLTNTISLRATREASPAVLPTRPDWFDIDYSNVSDFGDTTTKEEVNPISRGRGRRKPAVTDADAGVTFDAPLTMDGLTRFLDGFHFSEYTNVGFEQRLTPVAPTDPLDPPTPGANTFTIDQFGALMASKVAFGVGAFPLVYASNYVTDGNNGVKALDALPTAVSTTLSVPGIVAETGTPRSARLQFCGIRFAAADISAAFSSGFLQITSTAGVPDWAAFLTVGQFVWIGGVDTGSDGSGRTRANGLESDSPSAGTAIYGWARVRTIALNVLTLDKLDPLLGTAGTLSVTGANFDMLFGRFARNLDSDADADDARYQEYSWNFEAAQPNLLAGGATGYEYEPGSQPNQLIINWPVTGLTTIELGFIGQLPDDVTGTQALNADLSVPPTFNNGAGAGVNFFLTTDVISLATDVCPKGFTLTINNNASSEKCGGSLGPRFVNAGTFAYTMDGALALTTDAIRSAVRNNTTVTFAVAIVDEDGAIMVDSPSMTMAGGGFNLERDQTAQVNVTIDSHTDDMFGYDLASSLLPIVPRANRSGGGF